MYASSKLLLTGTIPPLAQKRLQLIINVRSKGTVANPSHKKAPKSFEFAIAVSKMARMKNTIPGSGQNKLTLPTHVSNVPFSNNAKSLSSIRYALGFDYLAKLPRLDQLRFAPIRIAGVSQYLPVGLVVGHYNSPYPASPCKGLPVYVLINDTTCERPNVYLTVWSHPSLETIKKNEMSGLGFNVNDALRTFDIVSKYVHFLPCFLAMNSREELAAQVRYCYLLAWEWNMKGMVSQGVPIGQNIETILKNMVVRSGTDAHRTATGTKRKRNELSPPAILVPDPKRLRQKQQLQAEPASKAQPLAIVEQVLDAESWPKAIEQTENADSDSTARFTSAEAPLGAGGTKPSPALRSEANLTYLQREARRGWSDTFAHGIHDALAEIHRMKAHFQQQLALSHGYLLARGAYHPMYQATRTEIDIMNREIEEEQDKMQILVEEKNRIDDELKEATEGEE